LGEGQEGTERWRAPGAGRNGRKRAGHFPLPRAYTSSNSIRNGLTFNAMKKLFAVALLGMVSWALIGSPVQAGEISKPGMSLVKHKKFHKKHRRHKTT
jgi:hypothetical protein